MENDLRQEADTEAEEYTSQKLSLNCPHCNSLKLQLLYYEVLDNYKLSFVCINCGGCLFFNFPFQNGEIITKPTPNYLG